MAENPKLGAARARNGTIDTEKAWDDELEHEEEVSSN